MSPLSNLAVRDVETLVHPYINLASFRETGPLVIERAQGVHVYDSNGKAYIEGMAGLWCTALGYGNEELVEAAAEQMQKLSFAHLFTGKSHDPAIELAEKLKEIAPVPISKVFFCNSGSEANDTQIKLVWYLNNARGKPQKKKIISRQGLSRCHRGSRVAHRAAGQSSRFRPAAAGLSAHQLSASLPLRAGRRERGGIRLAARRRA
jgi:4-aminobutyrate--pyruvate transaminase